MENRRENLLKEIYQDGLKDAKQIIKAKTRRVKKN